VPEPIADYRARSPKLDWLLHELVEGEAGANLPSLRARQVPPTFRSKAASSLSGLPRLHRALMDR
jgi:hypothetical protein